MGQFINYMNTTHGVTATAIIVFIALALFTIFFIFNVKVKDIILEISGKMVKLTGKNINRFEQNYQRDLEIGKIHDKTVKMKSYKFLNDLTIDLGYKRKGVTPYELLFFILLGSLCVSLIIGAVLFSNMLLSILAYPLVFATISCILYTKANLAHDNRIDAVIMAENIISNNIDKGVLVAIKSSIDNMPPSLQSDFKDFIDDIEVKNSYVKTALLDLNNKLGSVADDFIQKCITLELEEEAGLAGIFKDVVEVNNIKSEFRIDMKRKFEEVMTEFIIGSLIIFSFLGGAIWLYPILQTFYFKIIVGQLLLLGDALLIIGEFVYITYLRAQEL